MKAYRSCGLVMIVVIFGVGLVSAQAPPSPKPFAIQDMIDGTLKPFDADALEAKRVKTVNAVLARQDRERALVRRVELQIVFANRQALLRQPKPTNVIDEDIDDDDRFEGFGTPIEVSDRFFEQYIFNRSGNLGHWVEEMGIALENRINDAKLDSSLTNDDLAKLRLAGRGDLKRLLDEVDVAREEFERSKGTVEDLNPFLKNLRGLQIKVLSGPFTGDSLLEKTLKHLRNRKDQAGK